MNSSAITAALQTILQFIAPLGGLALFLTVGWVVWRTQSVHALRYRVWRLLYGRTEIQDPEIKRFVDERNDLIAFRFLSGINVRTREDASTLARWTRENNEDVRALGAAGRYFDAEELRVKTEQMPGCKTLAAAVILAFASFLMGTWGVKLASANHVFLQVKSTDRWFAVRSDGFSRVNFLGDARGPSVSLTRCKDSTKNGPVLPRTTDEDVLCGLLVDPEAPQYLSKTLEEQRWGIAVAAIVFGCFGASLVAFIRRAAEARQLSKRLVKRDVQMKLPFED